MSCQFFIVLIMCPEEELRHILALWLMPSFNSRKFCKILRKESSIKDLFHRGLSDWLNMGFTTAHVAYLRHPNWKEVDKYLHWNERSDHHVLIYHNPYYPKLLREIADPPGILFVKGSLKILSEPQVAIVGSRNPSPVGKETAYELAYHLSTMGVVVTSGLALGVDTAAHHGAVRAQGATIAVLGSGIERIYPNKNRDLADKIRENGAILSEFALNAAPEAYHFPKRNRIISGLCLGTVIVEATLKSGSLITANSALEQNREVFAVPGSIKNPLSRGCHHLIKSGAVLIETAEDVVSHLQIPLRSSLDPKPLFETPPASSPLDTLHKKLIECIDFETTSIDQVVTRSQWPISQVCSLLLDLELKGYIRAVLSGGYRRIK